MKQVRVTDEIREISVYDLEDFCIGHAQNNEAVTGCTAIICNRLDTLVAGADVRGGAPGTRNLDIMKPMNSYPGCQAVVLSGGSLYGLAAASGVEKYLEEKGIAFSIGPWLVPVVSQAIIFDLDIGDSNVRPDAEMGYAAAKDAFKKKKYDDGNVGAGIGATIGGNYGEKRMKGGLGTFCYKKGDLFVGAVMTVNCWGSVYDPVTGELVASPIDADGERMRLEPYLMEHLGDNDIPDNGNTTIGCIITNAKMDRGQAHKLAALAQDGLARAIRPVHTMSDGDTMFALSSGEIEASFKLVGILAVNVVQNAILNAVKNSESLDGNIGYKDTFAK